MIPLPQATPWSDTLDVSVNMDIAVRVHVGTVLGFTPTATTYRGMLYGPGTVHITDVPPGVDLYVRLASLDGAGVSASSQPVQITAL